MKPRSRVQLYGIAAAILTIAVLAAAMVPSRAETGSTTNALVLVVPVVLGVALGGWVAGVVAVAAGFLTYDYLFVKPYGTMATARVWDWLTLAVYVAVMLVVARVVSQLQQARAEARRRAEHTRHLLEVSDLLIGERPLSELLESVVQTVHREFQMSSVAVVLPAGSQVQVAAAAGAPLPPGAATEALLDTSRSTPVERQGAAGPRALPLTTAERTVGALMLAGPPLSSLDQQLLATYANHAALAVERAQLREQVLRSQVLMEIDGWRRALLGSVAHDLRTPLASIKASLSDLADPKVQLPDQDRRELLTTAEEETDRLTRLVANLLDVYRIEAGTRRLDVEAAGLAELVAEALEAVPDRLDPRPLTLEVPPEFKVRVDRALLVRVLVNLLENAGQHTPPGTPVSIRARAAGDFVELQVADRGPGMSPERLSSAFTPVSHSELAGEQSDRGGVGLSICKTFVEASGGRISAVSRRGGGLELDILLPAA